MHLLFFSLDGAFLCGRMEKMKVCEERKFSARCVMDFFWDMKTNKLFPTEERETTYKSSFPVTKTIIWDKSTRNGLLGVFP